MFLMTRPVLAGLAIAVCVTAALAQSDPIKERQNLMKGFGAATRTGTQMSRGEIPFDAAKAKEVFVTFETGAKRIPTLFPENSKTGGDTAADPKIWTNTADFQALAAKIGADAQKAAASVNDLETFKAAFGEVAKDCGACHQTYRLKKS
jgi:cytochrome c556